MTTSPCGTEKYVCTLDKKTLRRAKEELNEDEKNRMGAVETFRQWILQQPHIKCPIDTDFLLLFLRVRYFAQLEARELLMKFLTSRQKLAKWFKDIDTATPKFDDVVDDGAVLVLPERDDEGRKIVILRPGSLVSQMKAGYTVDDVFWAMAGLFDYIYLLDETTCVNGTVSIMDISGFSMKLNNSISMEDRKDFIQTWQKSYPARIKQIHMYNAGIMIDIILALVKLSMEEKIQKRIKNHGQVLESIYKDIPMRCLPVEYLPDDYNGPNAGTIKQIIENMKLELKKPAIRDRIKYLSSSQFGINETLKPKGDTPQASFRKLNLD